MNLGNVIDKSETEEGIVTVYDTGILISTINEGAYIDVPYLLKGKERLMSLRLGKNFYVLSEGVGFYRISKEARRLSASKEYSGHIAAVAVMTGHIAIKLIVDLYMKIDKPFSPTKAFMDRNLALKWLQEKRAQDLSVSVGHL